MKSIYKIAWILKKILQELRYQSYLKETVLDSADIPYIKRSVKNGKHK